jgi:hypothetical protein
MGADVVDELFREELLRLKTQKAALEARIRELEATCPDQSEAAQASRKTIEFNLADFKRAKSGASQVMLKRLMRRVIESIVLEPGRIALRYWTSNELRDERQSSKAKRASDSKSGATVLQFPVRASSPDNPLLTPTRDDAVSCSDIVRTGRGDWTRTSNLMLPKHARYQLRYTPT